MKKKNILFLGYSSQQTLLIERLIFAGCSVDHRVDLPLDVAKYDLIISYGYNRIIPANVLDSLHVPFINLHISLLPWNRGAHPNFWSFYDNTPSGVSIHMIDAGVDTGDILFQKEVFFTDVEDTFRRSYNRLRVEIEELFTANISNIIHGEYRRQIQSSIGTFHSIKDLPIDFRGWDANIKAEIKRLKQM